jgi:hypothetical protein
MRFSSLSEAIEYYSYEPDPLQSLPPYSDLAVQIGAIPQNVSYVPSAPQNVVIYGTTIWGFGKITSVSNPLL